MTTKPVSPASVSPEPAAKPGTKARQRDMFLFVLAVLGTWLTLETLLKSWIPGPIGAPLIAAVVLAALFVAIEKVPALQERLKRLRPPALRNSRRWLAALAVGCLVLVGASIGVASLSHSSSQVPVSLGSSPRVTATIPVGSQQPLSVAVSPDGQHAYAGGLGTVSVIDTTSNTVTATISVPDAGRLAITPDGRYVYVVGGSNSVWVIDTASNTVTATIPVGKEPFDVAISRDGIYAYVADASSDALSVINTASNTVIATIPVGIFPTGVAVSPDGLYVYVTNATTNDVSVIDTATDTVTATITTGSGAFAVAVSPDGRHAYVANLNAGSVSVIDTASNTVTATLTVGSHPFDVAFAPDGRYAYVTDGDSDGVSVINTASNTVIATVPLVSPAGVVFAPDGRHACITNRYAKTITVVDTGTG